MDKNIFDFLPKGSFGQLSKESQDRIISASTNEAYEDENKKRMLYFVGGILSVVHIIIVALTIHFRSGSGLISVWYQARSVVGLSALFIIILHGLKLMIMKKGSMSWSASSHSKPELIPLDSQSAVLAGLLIFILSFSIYIWCLWVFWG